ncbi:class I SAM-dependent methyltransferase [Candidatus Bathyarchaeota archaeon]|nr:MAG: class I SAM-dependent methyltransferase [Candidatus Bathyarchaeota archaeon]
MVLKERAWELFDQLNDYWVEIVDARFTEREIDLIRTMGEQDLVLDLCCGTGRHSILLTGQGWDMVGLDMSANLLRKARHSMDENKIRFPLVRGDMRQLPFKSKVFSAVVNMFTSFGYLPSEEEDMKCLEEITRVLRQDGLFLLDVVNKNHLVHTFRKRDWGEFRSFYLLEERNLNDSAQLLWSRWVLLDKKGSEIGVFDHYLRLYSFLELKAMLCKAGMNVLDVYGGYEGQPFEQNASRMIVLAGKV